MITILAEAVAGDSVEDISISMQKTADSLRVCIKLKFNDVYLFAYPDGSARKLIEDYKASVGVLATRMVFSR